MGCTIPGCGSSGHNRRTHDKHVPPGEALIEQGDPLAATRGLAHGSLLRAELEREARASSELDRVNGLLVPRPGVVVERGTVDPTDEPISDDDRFWDEVVASDARADQADVEATFPAQAEAMEIIDEAATAEALAAVEAAILPATDDESADWSDDDAPEPSGDFTVARCQECGEPLDDGQSFLCGSCAVQDQHECEPAPDQVWFCRYCGDDLREDGPLPADIVPLPVPPWRTVLGPAEPIRITLPGCYELTSEQYHSFEVTGDWFSNSDAKKLLQTCPAQFDYDRRNGVKKISDAFDFGHVAHAVVLGDGERYEVFEPKRIDRRTKEGQAQQKAVDEARAAGRTPIYGDQFALIEAMAEAIKADPIPHELLTQPGRPEVCLFWHEQIKVTDPHNSLYGQTVQVKRRAMIDHLPDLTEDGKAVRIVDYKTADEVKPDDSLRKKVYDYGYHRQSATYEAAVECLFGRSADVVFLLQSKKPPHLIVPVEMDTPAVRVAVAENNQAMALWAECVATGEWPGYVRGVAVSGVPAWIERQFEEVTVIN